MSVTSPMRTNSGVGSTIGVRMAVTVAAHRGRGPVLEVPQGRRRRAGCRSSRARPWSGSCGSGSFAHLGKRSSGGSRCGRSGALLVAGGDVVVDDRLELCAMLSPRSVTVSPSTNTGAAVLPGARQGEMPMLACFAIRPAIDHAAHHRERRFSDAVDTRATPASAPAESLDPPRRRAPEEGAGGATRIPGRLSPSA